MSSCVIPTEQSADDHKYIGGILHWKACTLTRRHRFLWQTTQLARPMVEGKTAASLRHGIQKRIRGPLESLRYGMTKKSGRNVSDDAATTCKRHEERTAALHKRYDIGGGAGNVLLDSLGEAGERPALPRNCKMSFVILVESGDRANRWSRKNLRGRGRLQDAYRRSAGTYPRGDSSLLATSIFTPRSLGRATGRRKQIEFFVRLDRAAARGVMSRRSLRRLSRMWGSLR